MEHFWKKYAPEQLKDKEGWSITCMFMYMNSKLDSYHHKTYGEHVEEWEVIL